MYLCINQVPVLVHLQQMSGNHAREFFNKMPVRTLKTAAAAGGGRVATRSSNRCPQRWQYLQLLTCCHIFFCFSQTNKKLCVYYFCCCLAQGLIGLNNRWKSFKLLFLHTIKPIENAKNGWIICLWAYVTVEEGIHKVNILQIRIEAKENKHQMITYMLNHIYTYICSYIPPKSSTSFPYPKVPSNAL